MVEFRISGRHRRGPIFLVLCFLLPASFVAAKVSAAQDIAPFYTFNQSPIIQIHGLPAIDRASVLSPTKKSYQLVTDRANNFSGKHLSNEQVFFDGETQRVVFAYKQGLVDGVEWGFDIPWISHSGGVLDRFVESWHSLLGLSQKGRDKYPRNKLLYAYQRNGNTQLDMTESGSGIGDIRVKGGWQIQKANTTTGSNIALRALLSLPTGDSRRLMGSGGLDAAVWLSAENKKSWFGNPGNVWGGAGVILLGGGDVLQGQQRKTALFGSVGSGAKVSQAITLKLQLDMHSSFYRNSHLVQINANAVQLVMGGDIGLANKAMLDLAVKEDLTINASPDVVFHIGLTVEN